MPSNRLGFRRPSLIFVGKIEQEQGVISGSSQFLKGYQQCVIDLLSDIDDKNESTLSMLITAKIEHKTKAAIYKEILSNLSAINKGLDSMVTQRPIAGCNNAGHKSIKIVLSSR